MHSEVIWQTNFIFWHLAMLRNINKCVQRTQRNDGKKKYLASLHNMGMMQELWSKKQKTKPKWIPCRGVIKKKKFNKYGCPLSFIIIFLWFIIFCCIKKGGKTHSYPVGLHSLSGRKNNELKKEKKWKKIKKLWFFFYIIYNDVRGLWQRSARRVSKLLGILGHHT